VLLLLHLMSSSLPLPLLLLPLFCIHQHLLAWFAFASPLSRWPPGSCALPPWFAFVFMLQPLRVCVHSLSLVLWFVCIHPLFYLWYLSTTTYL
jgi:hypothetical protein